MPRRKTVQQTNSRTSSRPTRSDLALGAILGAAVAESPFTPNEIGPSLAIGVLVAAYFLWYRTTHRAQTVPGAARDRREDALRRLREVPVVAWAALVGWLAIFAPTLLWMYDKWTGSFWHNNHSMMVAVLIVVITHGTLRRHRDSEYDVSLWGLPLVAMGFLFALTDIGVHGQQLASIGFVISLPGMVLLLLGKQRLRALHLPLAMSIFLVPVPSLVANHLFLRSVTADWTLVLLQELGVRASLYYTQIETPDHTFIVSEACSGFSTLVAAVSLSFFLFAACRSTPRRIALMLAILPLTLAANTLRVLILVIASMNFGVEMLDTAMHEGSGVATFVIVIASLFWIAGRPKITEAFT
jgi:exosortase